MPFCRECGYKMTDEATVCLVCGWKTGEEIRSKRQEEWAGKIVKCPNCGDLINAFVSSCPSCNYELRGSKVSNVVKEFADKLEQIEKNRSVQKGKSIFEKVSDLSTGDYYLTKTDKQKINLIKNFPVPNTKEDILEFIVLASTNINDDSYAYQNLPVEKQLSDAWLSKMEQAYHKAKLTFGTEADFSKIQDIYDNKMKAIKKVKKRNSRNIFLLISFFLFLFLLLGVESCYSTSKEEKKERELNKIVDEVYEDIEKGDYDAALKKANDLYFDDGLSQSKADKWDEKRISIIGLINVKKTNKQGKIKVNYSPKELKGMNYEKAEEILKLQGFTNIKLEKNDDLVLRILAKEDEVEKVTIDGDTDFKRDTYYMSNVEIIITYHTY